MGRRVKRKGGGEKEGGLGGGGERQEKGEGETMQEKGEEERGWEAQEGEIRSLYLGAEREGGEAAGEWDVMTF